MADARASDLTEEALRRSGLEDMRPALRRLLVRLKEKDPVAFEEAGRRYREDLEPSIVGGEDPIRAWLVYGAWLAALLVDGNDLAIDGSGRSRPFEPSRDAGPGLVILHMPNDERAPALLLAYPSDPSEAQRETVALLVR